MRRFATTYFMFVVYGAVVWGTEDQIRPRPGWAQWGMLLLWGLSRGRSQMACSAAAETTSSKASWRSLSCTGSIRAGTGADGGVKHPTARRKFGTRRPGSADRIASGREATVK
jgi:hypothetical protein